MASQPNNPVAVIRQNLAAMAPELKAALPAHVSVEKFSRVAMTAIQQTPALQNADRRSLFGAVVRLAQDGLLPDGREAAIVMFGNKAQAMPMIAGVLKKIRQSGEVAKVSAQVVHENDHFVWKLGFDEDVEHAPPPLDQPRGKPIGAYATAVLKDGSRLLEVMSLEEIEAVRNVSRAKGNGPWVTWWGEMARKTVMRRLSKRLPMSTDLDEEVFARDPSMATELDKPDGAVIEADRTDEPTSRLDALEHHIEGDEAADRDSGEIQTEPAEQAEEAEFTETGETEEQEPEQEEKADPAAQRLAKLREQIEAANSLAAANIASNEWAKHRVAYDDETIAEVDGLVSAAFKRVRGEGQ